MPTGPWEQSPSGTIIYTNCPSCGLLIQQGTYHECPKWHYTPTSWPNPYDKLGEPPVFTIRQVQDEQRRKDAAIVRKRLADIAPGTFGFHAKRLEEIAREIEEGIEE